MRSYVAWLRSVVKKKIRVVVERRRSWRLRRFPRSNLRGQNPRGYTIRRTTDEGRPRDQSQDGKSAFMRSKKAHRKAAHGFSPPALLDRCRNRSSVTSGVVAVIIPVSVAVVRRIAIAVVRRITVAVRGTIPVAVIRIRIVGPCKCAADDRAHGEAAKRWAPAPPARIRRGGRGNCRDRDSRRCESDKRFPHGFTSILEPRC